MRKIFIVVERRADYSRYFSIIKKIQTDRFFKLHLVVTGICLLKNHGSDLINIKKDGIKIDSKIKMFNPDVEDSGAEMVKAMSRFMTKIVDELKKVKPDIVLSGFDIGANFAVTVAAAHMNIPVAHIQGGEISGSIDESLRHAMSKFAHIHFPATELSKKRLISMGENPKSIFIVGCPSIDVLITAPKMSQKELTKIFQIDFSKKYAILLQHSVTTENTKSEFQIGETIAALMKFNIQTIAILPNNDAGYLPIFQKIKSTKFKLFPSLPLSIYASLLRRAAVLIGNSSSGIHEAATFKVPVINIGSRQNGREKSINVIDVSYDRNKIYEALKKTTLDEKFIGSLIRLKNPYGNGHSAEKIVAILKKISLQNIIQKQYYE